MQAGAIGKVITPSAWARTGSAHPRARPGSSIAPHHGGILTDIASHQCEQFLFFANSQEVEVRPHRRQPRPSRKRPGCRTSASCCCATKDATGYVRVDWFTPDGPPTWGDGRLVILGPRAISSCANMSTSTARPGSDHLLLVDGKGVQRIDCSQVVLPYGPALIQDVLNRTETAMGQAHCFKAMEVALTAQALAERGYYAR